MIEDVWGEHGQKWVWSVWSQDSKIQTERNKFIFDTDSQKLKVDQKFFAWAWLKMGVASVVIEL